MSTDDGPGIDRELLPRLFEAFAQGAERAGRCGRGPLDRPRHRRGARRRRQRRQRGRGRGDALHAAAAGDRRPRRSPREPPRGRRAAPRAVAGGGRTRARADRARARPGCRRAASRRSAVLALRHAIAAGGVVRRGDVVAVPIAASDRTPSMLECARCARRPPHADRPRGRRLPRARCATSRRALRRSCATGERAVALELSPASAPDLRLLRRGRYVDVVMIDAARLARRRARARAALARERALRWHRRHRAGARRARAVARERAQAAVSCGCCCAGERHDRPPRAARRRRARSTRSCARRSPTCPGSPCLRRRTPPTPTSCSRPTPRRPPQAISYAASGHGERARACC